MSNILFTSKICETFCPLTKVVRIASVLATVDCCDSFYQLVLRGGPVCSAQTAVPGLLVDWTSEHKRLIIQWNSRLLLFPPPLVLQRNAIYFQVNNFVWWWWSDLYRSLRSKTTGCLVKSCSYRSWNNVTVLYSLYLSWKLKHYASSRRNTDSERALNAAFS